MKILKGAVSRYSVIFCAFFTRAKNGGCSRKCRGHQTWKLGRPRGLPAWPPTLAADMTVPWTNDKSSQSCTASGLSRSTATGCTFVFRLRGPSKVISPSSRFKISSDSYIDIDSLFGCLVLRAFRSLLRRSRPGRRNRQCGRSSLSSDFDDVYVCHCEGKCAERGTRCRHSCQHRLCCGIRTVRLEDSRNALVVSCGDVQLGDRGRSKETLRALACRPFSSSLPEGALLSTAHPAVHLEMRRW